MTTRTLENGRLGPPAGMALEVLQRVKEDVRPRLIDGIFDSVVDQMRVDVSDIRRDVLAKLHQEGIPLGPGEPQAKVMSAIAECRATESKAGPEAGNGEAFTEFFEAEGHLAPQCAVSSFELSAEKASVPSPLDLVRSEAVQAAEGILGAHIVGTLMGVRPAREAVVRAWLKGDIETCEPATCDLLYCYAKNGPRVPDGQWNQLTLATLGFPAGVTARGKVNSGFGSSLDKLVQAATSCLCQDGDSDDEWLAKSAFLTVAVLALKENLTAHVPESAQVQAKDVEFDVAEGLKLLTDVADNVLQGCDLGPWALVQQFLPDKTNLGGLWMLRQAVGTVLNWVAALDLNKAVEETSFLKDVAPAIWTIRAQTLPTGGPVTLSPAQRRVALGGSSPSFLGRGAGLSLLASTA